MKPDLLCQDPSGCERRWIRTRGGIRVCAFHPEVAPPPLVAGGALDAKRGEEPKANTPPKRETMFARLAELDRVGPRTKAVGEVGEYAPPAPDITSNPSSEVEEPDVPAGDNGAKKIPPHVTPLIVGVDSARPVVQSTLRPAGGDLLERGESHRNREVRRAAKAARDAVERLAGALSYADRRSR